jgi:hypothetical protein
MVRLPDGWVAVEGAEAERLELELRRELPRMHQLSGLILVALARRLDADDVLFGFLASDQDEVFCVHLTWSIESHPQWPSTEVYDSIEAFAERWSDDDRDGR